jgi:parallel beta-helix repeat protein
MKTFLRLILFCLPALCFAQSPIDDVQMTGTANQIKASSTFTGLSGSTLAIASGGTINVNSGATVIFGDPLSIANGGTGRSLTDPNAHRLWGWNDTNNRFEYITIGSGLTFNATTSTLTSAGGGGSGANVFSVVDYGATGNGSTDDRAAIQAAVDAANTAGGGVVYFPIGSYAVTSGTVTVSSTAGITLRGAGIGSVIKSTVSTQGAKVTITGTNVGVEMLKFDGGYTSGAHSGDFGLINITDGKKVRIRLCTFVNSLDRAIRIRGAAEDLDISYNVFSNHFEAIHSFATSSSAIPQRIAITHNFFRDNWGTGAETGAVKLQNGQTTRSAGHIVSDNIISNTGQMGIELWNSLADSTITGNTIERVEFGISLDGTIRTAVTGNTVKLVTYTGIESATSTADNTITGNIVSGYNSSGTRTGTYGIITSNTPPTRIAIVGNSVRGFTSAGVQLQTTTNSLVAQNQISDCVKLISLQGSSYIDVKGNQLLGPCSYHVWIEAFGGNQSNIAIEENRLTGLAGDDNLMIYDSAGTYTISNVIVKHNDVGDATYTNLSFNLNCPLSRLPYFLMLDNYSVPGTSKASWADGGRTDQLPIPFFSGDQAKGLPVAKKFTFSVGSSAGDQWFKIFSLDWGSPLVLPLHVYANAIATDNKASSITAAIGASPYGQDAAIFKFPDGNYQGGSIKGIIYNNPSSGSVHEVWLRFGPTAGITVEVYGSDWASSWITAPSAVTSTPSWASNTYELDTTTGNSTLKARYAAFDEIALRSNTPASTTNKFYQISGTPYFNGSAIPTAGTTMNWTGIHTWSPTLAANTSGDGIVLSNPTAATSGNQRYSPALHWQGQGWKTTATAASQTVDMKAELQPVQGTANPTGVLVISSQVNGGGYTTRFTIDTAGNTAATGTLSTSSTFAASVGDKIGLSGQASIDSYYLAQNYTNTDGTESVLVSARGSWRTLMRNATTTEYGIDWRAASAGAGTFTRLFTLSQAGNLTLAGTGTHIFPGDIRIQNSGSTAHYLHLYNGSGNNETLIRDNGGSGASLFEVQPAGVASFSVATGSSGIKFNNYGAGTLSTDASGNITASSDERLKSISGPFQRGLTALHGVAPIVYHWNAKSHLDENTAYAGFSAQNVQKNIPEAVGTGKDGMLTLQDRPIIAALVNAVHELEARVAELEKKQAAKK